MSSYEMKVVKTRKYKSGYEIRTEQFTDNNGYVTELKQAYTIPEGYYIGSSKDAYRLIVKRGIRPQPRMPECKEANAGRGRTCSIGFCEKEQKWYGWSHRSIYGFGIGSSVKKGDCMYSPTGKDDFLECLTLFWHDDCHSNVCSKHVREGGLYGVHTSWTYNDKTPNEALRGKRAGVFNPYPGKYGNGEWTAKTLEDAKQMANDYAEGV